MLDDKYSVDNALGRNDSDQGVDLTDEKMVLSSLMGMFERVWCIEGSVV